MTSSQPTQPLTEDALAAIKGRVAALATSIGGETRQQAYLADDVPVLLAEIDRHRAAAVAVRADALDWAASVFRISRNDEPDQLDSDPAARLQRLAAGVRAGRHDDIQTEVDRLRISNADLFRRLGEHMDDLGDANTEVSRLRAENTAQADQLAAVRAIPAIEIGIYWNSQGEAEATGRNATLLEVRRILNGGEPRRDDRTQGDILRDFERDMRTVRALGLDQDGGSK